MTAFLALMTYGTVWLRLYAATKEPAVAAATLVEFEQRYADAPQYPEVALKLADCYQASSQKLKRLSRSYCGFREVFIEGYCQVKFERCNQTFRASYSTDAHRFSIPSSSFPHRVHQSLCVAIFPLLLEPDVEEMMVSRGLSLTYETVRESCLKFGQTYANALRCKSPRPGDRWHLDEVFLKLNGRLHYLWRAVDQDGDVLDILVQRHRDKKAAKKFFRKLLKRLQYVPNVIITDKLRSYSAGEG